MRSQDIIKKSKRDSLFKAKRGLFVVSGFVSLFLAILGIFLPILPTTPFLLLSAYCFARASKKWYDWLLNHKYFGKIIRDYHQRKGVTLGIKIYALSLLWITILISVIFAIEMFFVDVLLIFIAMVVSLHIIKLKTLRG